MNGQTILDNKLGDVDRQTTMPGEREREGGEWKDFWKQISLGSTEHDRVLNILTMSATMLLNHKIYYFRYCLHKSNPSSIPQG